MLSEISQIQREKHMFSNKGNLDLNLYIPMYTYIHMYMWDVKVQKELIKFTT